MLKVTASSRLDRSHEGLQQVMYTNVSFEQLGTAQIPAPQGKIVSRVQLDLDTEV